MHEPPSTTQFSQRALSTFAVRSRDRTPSKKLLNHDSTEQFPDGRHVAHRSRERASFSLRRACGATTRICSTSRRSATSRQIVSSSLPYRRSRAAHGDRSAPSRNFRRGRFAIRMHAPRCAPKMGARCVELGVLRNELVHRRSYVDVLQRRVRDRRRHPVSACGQKRTLISAYPDKGVRPKGLEQG